MAVSCCDNKSADLALLAQKQSRVLWTVLAINILMFGVELYSGLRFDSLALMGDSLDMFGDALAYGSSLFVLGLGVRAKARASQLKAFLMIALGLLVAVQALVRLTEGTSPAYEVMSGIGLLALVANLICLALLTRHRHDDINFSSVWVCSRNDIIANISVLIAAALVFLTGSFWPDLVIGLAIAVLFLRSAAHILRDAGEALAEAPTNSEAP